MKKADYLRSEFIGKNVVVPEKGIEGRIIDETKKLFLVSTKKKVRKMVLKANSTFRMMFDSKPVDIPGNLISMRPEDRIKIKKWQ